jgi:hypothetical protein
MTLQDLLPDFSGRDRRDDIRADLPGEKISPDLRFSWSGRRDLNPRPLAVRWVSGMLAHVCPGHEKHKPAK